VNVRKMFSRGKDPETEGRKSRRSAVLLCRQPDRIPTWDQSPGG